MNRKASEKLALEERNLGARRNGAARFVIRICLDVFLEVLRSGTRRQLAGLEKIGGRFRLVIDGYFGEKPFLRLKLALRPSSKLLYVSDIVISQTALSSLPRFIRFMWICIRFSFENQLSAGSRGDQLSAGSRWTQTILRPLKTLLIGAEFEFSFEKQSSQSNYTKLLDHIEKELLPICNACCSYKFDIRFNSDMNNLTTLIASILHLEPVIRCSNVQFDCKISPGLRWNYGGVQLPVAPILSWLLNADSIQKRKERILKISPETRILNFGDMIDRLKKTFEESMNEAQPFSLVLEPYCPYPYPFNGVADQILANIRTGDVLSIKQDGRKVTIKRSVGEE